MPITNTERLPTLQECLQRRNIKNFGAKPEAAVFCFCLVLIAAFGVLSFAKVYSQIETQNSTQSKLALINDTLTRILSLQQNEPTIGMAKWTMSEREAKN